MPLPALPLDALLTGRARPFTRPGSRSGIAKSPRDGALRVTPVGLEEGRLLSGWQEPADIAAFYLDMGVDAVAIKLGPSGAYYRDAHGEGLVPGVPVATVVDTVGAGDGFAVGVVSALLEGLPLPDAVARGNWIGSRAVQVRGDMEGLPKRSQLLDRERRRSA